MLFSSLCARSIICPTCINSFITIPFSPHIKIYHAKSEKGESKPTQRNRTNELSICLVRFFYIFINFNENIYNAYSIPCWVCSFCWFSTFLNICPHRNRVHFLLCFSRPLTHTHQHVATVSLNSICEPFSVVFVYLAQNYDISLLFFFFLLFGCKPKRFNLHFQQMQLTKIKYVRNICCGFLLLNWCIPKTEYWFLFYARAREGASDFNCNFGGVLCTNR